MSRGCSRQEYRRGLLRTYQDNSWSWRRSTRVNWCWRLCAVWVRRNVGLLSKKDPVLWWGWACNKLTAEEQPELEMAEGGQRWRTRAPAAGMTFSKSCNLSQQGCAPGGRAQTTLGLSYCPWICQVDIRLYNWLGFAINCIFVVWMCFSARFAFPYSFILGGKWCKL